MTHNNFKVVEKERRKSQINKFFKQKQFSFYVYNDGLTGEICRKYEGFCRLGAGMRPLIIAMREFCESVLRNPQ